MLRRTIGLILIILMVSFISGCTFNPSVEDLLVAPSLSEEQESVLNALAAGRSNRISFVYPLTGTNRSAIQKYDIDGDGQDEIIAFYKDSSEGLNANISILEQNPDSSYYVASTSEGFGDSINSVFYLSSLVAEDAILVDWESPSKSSNTVSVYTYIGSKLEIGFEENSLNMIVLDTDDTQSSAFCYIVPATAESTYSLKYVQSNESTIFSRSQYNLNEDVIEVISLKTGRFKDGSNALFIDESTSYGLQTEIFSLTDDFSRLSRAEIEGGLDLLKLSARETDNRLVSTDFNGITCFPSSIPPNTEVLNPENLVYWYSLDSSIVSFEYATFYSSSWGILFPVPSSWLSFCKINQISENTIEIRDNEDQLLVSIVQVSVDDDIMNYIKEGYYLVGTNGTTRYYMVCNTTDEDENLIKQSFIVFS